jgi:HEAT repeat protein
MMRVLAMLLLCGTALAAPEPTMMDRVLGGYERAATAEDVKRLGADADRQLIDVAVDARTTRLRRTRAIAALRFVPSTAAHAFLRAVVLENKRATAGADVLDLAAAIYSLSPYTEETSLVLSFVAHGSADVRQSAAAALAAIADPAAAGPLRARLAVERDAGVRLTLQHALKSLEPAR